MDEDEKVIRKMDTPEGKQSMTIISEMEFIKLFLIVRNLKLKPLRVKQTLNRLRKQSGLESYQTFRMMDKGHQKIIMKNLHINLPKPERSILLKPIPLSIKLSQQNKVILKWIKKGDVTYEMLAERQPILNDTAELAEWSSKQILKGN